MYVKGKSRKNPSTLFNRVKNQHANAEKRDISEKFGEYKENNKENKSFAVF